MRASDVAVIGGGHNGLVAACCLARRGLRAVVLEANEYLGGMTASRAFASAAPEHILSPCAYENVYLRAAGIVAQLGLERHGYRELPAAGWAWLGPDGQVLHLQGDVERTIRDIARFSAADARRYRELVAVGLRLLPLQDEYGRNPPSRPSARLLGRAARALIGDRRVRAAIPALLAGTAADAIESTFESEEVRGAFASIGSILAPPTVEGSGIAMLAPALLHHMGAARPVGGMGGLVAALESCLQSHGGEARTGARAVRIEVAGGRATGVELESGEVIQAKAVLAAVPPQRLPDLLGDALAGEEAARLRGAPANSSGVGTLTVSLALSGRLELSRHALSDGGDLRRPTLFTGTFAEVLDACRAAAQGRLPDRLPWCAAIFTAIDPSQAPPGEDVVQLYAPTPVAPAAGWEAVRGEAAKALLSQAASALDGLQQLEIGRFVETPLDLARRTGAENGCIYHVDHLPTRLGPLRPGPGLGGYRLPITGLFMTGAGHHPGGGVSGLPGRNAARVMLSDAALRS